MVRALLYHAAVVDLFGSTLVICLPQQISEWAILSGQGQPTSYTSTALQESQR